ncbi:MAG: thermonuclease family protein [Wolinella sp.]
MGANLQKRSALSDGVKSFSARGRIFAGIVLLILSILHTFVLHAFEAPLSLHALLKRVHSATLFSFYSPQYDYLSCPLFGVAPLQEPPAGAPCEIAPRRLKEMAYHARNFTLERLFLEQKYRLGFASNWCFLQDGGELFNAVLVREGYAPVYPIRLQGTQGILEELLELQEIAKREKRGLWKEWRAEMECLSSLARERASKE